MPVSVFIELRDDTAVVPYGMECRGGPPWPPKRLLECKAKALPSPDRSGHQSVIPSLSGKRVRVRGPDTSGHSNSFSQTSDKDLLNRIVLQSKLGKFFFGGSPLIIPVSHQIILV